MAFLGKIGCILNKGPALWVTFVEYVFIRNQNPKFNFEFKSKDRSSAPNSQQKLQEYP